jgi:hypothetical protein
VTRWVGRAIGLDVHRDFCVVAICEDGVTRPVGRVPSTREGISTLAESLLPSDRVALEVTGSCWEVARILESHVNWVVVVSPDDAVITSARAKADRLDARALANSLWRGGLEPVWMLERNVESTARQYALVERATELGFCREQVVVIDEDLGISGSGMSERSGFARLAAEVALGRAGLVVGLEVSGLARNNVSCRPRHEAFWANPAGMPTSTRNSPQTG